MNDSVTFRPIRRTKRALDIRVAKQLLIDSRRGVLAVNGDNGYPYAVPINYLYDPETDRIYFHGARAGHKYDSIKACDRVCFTVYGNETIKDEPWAPYMQSAVAFGRCRPVDDPGEAFPLLKRLAMKYFPDESIADKEIASSGKAAQVYVIEIEHLTAKQVQER